MKPAYRILEYVGADGSAPVTEWLRRLSDLRARAMVLVRLKRAELGNLGRYRGVGEGVMELKVETGPGYRIYFALPGREELLLLAAGSKTAQRRDIAIAHNRWNDFKARKGAVEFGS